MNKGFMLLDKTNNSLKSANSIIKFNYENKDYLVYSIDENDNNKQIFTSRLILNSEGKYFIDNLSPEEKDKINNIVYNIIILTPTEHKNGKDAKLLIDSLSSKLSTKISINIPELGEQEYYNNCSIAITSNELVLGALEFYQTYLEENSGPEKVLTPAWTIPAEVNEPKIDSKTEMTPIENEPAFIPNTNSGTIKNEELIMPTNNIQDNAINVQNVINNEINSLTNNITENNENNQVIETELPIDYNQNTVIDNQITPIFGNANTNNETVKTEESIMPIGSVNEENLPNPQKEKLAVVSDPSLSNFGIDLRGIQPNMQNVKKAGFAVNKHIIIGTICLVLAVAVVVVAYFLIKNMK